MAHHVYANGNEIASTSSQGDSIGAAPDVCMSPPGPSAGPVPIPYSNSCIFSDLSNLATTVFVGGAGMALEDKSFFSTSYGDEPATSSYSKGVISGKVQGKCFFQSWSMNVKAEGLGVDRHLDIVTHNHSNMANTPAIVYKSREFNKAVCKTDRDKIKDECKPKKKREKKNAKKANGKRGPLAKALSGFSKKLDEAAQKATGYKPNKKNGWIEDYCDGLWASKLPDDLKGQVEEYKKEIVDLNNKIQEMDTTDLAKHALDEAIKQVPDGVIKRQLEETAGKAVIKATVGAVGAETIVVPIVLWAWTAYDLYQVKSKLTEVIGDAAGEYMDMITDTDKVKEKLQEQVDALTAEKENTPNKVFGKMQELKANSSPCLKARKCKLTTFDNSKKIAGKDSCCPGQTGHHLLPDAMFRTNDQSKRETTFNDWYNNDYNGSKTKEKAKIPRDKIPKKDCWGDYSEGGSLTICAEGGAAGGSHGTLHTNTADIIKKARGEDKTELNYTDIRSEMAEEVKETYGCKKKCIEAQLDEYYSKAYSNTCGDLEKATVVAHTGQSKGGPPVPKPKPTKEIPKPQSM